MNNDYVPKEISSLLNLIDTYKRWDRLKNNNRKYESYHPSEWGKCLRQQQYKHYTEKGLIEVPYGVISSQHLRLFDKGHFMHRRWVSYFNDIGILRGKWQCLNPACFLFDDNGQVKKKLSNEDKKKIIRKNKTRLHGKEDKHGIFRPKECVCGCSQFGYEEVSVIDKKINIRGHCDVLLDCSTLDPKKFEDVRVTFDPKFLPINGKILVGDMKSIGQSSWDYNLMRKKEPHKYYVIQLISYIHILDVDYGVLMYENKNTSEMKWYKIERNDKWWNVIKWQAEKMIEMTENKELPPPRPKDKTNYDCKNCEYKSLCHKSGIWKDPNLEQKRKNFYKCLL